MQHGPLAPYLIVAPRGLPLPLVLSSPHSGVTYPEDMLAQSRLTQRQLRGLDDGPVDGLLAAGCAAGATLIAATYPRAVVDLNRHPADQDPDSLSDPECMPGLRPTVRARSGLGVVPTRLLRQPIYAARLSAAEIRRRLAQAHQPYHAQLAALAAERRSQTGVSLVLDCHSMPTVVTGRGERAIDVALGDRFGRSCHPRLTEVAEGVLAGAGLSVARNRPYAGGYITEHHGRPAMASHALQLELRRGLFMHESTHAPNDGFDSLRDLLGELVRALADTALGLVEPDLADRPAALRSA